MLVVCSWGHHRDVSAKEKINLAASRLNKIVDGNERSQEMELAKEVERVSEKMIAMIGRWKKVEG